MRVVDAKKLACPAPVLLVKDAVEQNDPSEIQVLVDNEASRENVGRFLGSKGFAITVEEAEGLYTLTGKREGGTEPADQAASEKVRDDSELRKVVVLVTADCLGSGDDGLGRKLMVNYLKTLKEMGEELWHLIFVNGGVKLTVADSPVLADLQDYEQAGVTVLACGTCLEHFGLTAEKKVGDTTNMLDIVSATQVADKVITIA